jgi:Saxitoxin biosynthesis operon protein SxtJ
MHWISEIIFELNSISSKRKDLVKFGLVIGCIFVALGFLIHHQWMIILGIVLIVLGLLMPSLLKYPYLVWMSFGVIAGFFVFRAILVILFYLAIFPMSIIAGFFGRDAMGLKAKNDSHWVPHTPGGTPDDPY